MQVRTGRHGLASLTGLLVVGAMAWAQDPAAPPAPVPAPAQDAAAPAAGARPGPPAIPEAPLAPMLKTVPVKRGEVAPGTIRVDASPLPKDREGIWVLDFAFKPVRLVTVEVPGRGRRTIHYLYYRVINNTGQPRMFVPQFTLVTDTGKRYEDIVLPEAVRIIQAREGQDASKQLLGAVEVVGALPPSGAKQGIDDAVYGVAMWEGIDPEADAFNIFVRGLSDGYQLLPNPEGGEPATRYKTLRIDFNRPGDALDLNEREIRLADPPYEWVYW
jgi:hypothetical protein